MVFNKKRADDRKNWLSNYHRDIYLNTSKMDVTYEEFINNDMIHFSKYDNDRSIPNICDGLKISLRKILYSAFKKTLAYNQTVTPQENTGPDVAHFSSKKIWERERLRGVLRRIAISS